MNRRDFIRSLIASLAAALVPWRLSVPAKAMGWPVTAGFVWGGDVGHELFVPYTDLPTLKFKDCDILGNGDVIWHQNKNVWVDITPPGETVKSAEVLDTGEVILFKSTSGNYAITKDGGVTWEKIDANQAQREREYYSEIVYTFSEGSYWG